MRYLSNFTSPSWPNKRIGEDGPKNFSKYCFKVLDLLFSVGMSMIDGLGFSPQTCFGVLRKNGVVTQKKKMPPQSLHLR